MMKHSKVVGGAEGQKIIWQRKMMRKERAGHNMSCFV
jgi:hypothetical protein